MVDRAKKGESSSVFRMFHINALRCFVVIPPTPAFSLEFEEVHMEIYRSGIFTQPSTNDLWRGGGAVGDH